jgi:hypothetical protein
LSLLESHHEPMFMSIVFWIAVFYPSKIQSTPCDLFNASQHELKPQAAYPISSHCSRHCGSTACRWLHQRTRSTPLRRRESRRPETLDGISIVEATLQPAAALKSQPRPVREFSAGRDGAEGRAAEASRGFTCGGVDFSRENDRAVSLPEAAG